MKREWSLVLAILLCVSALSLASCCRRLDAGADAAFTPAERWNLRFFFRGHVKGFTDGHTSVHLNESCFGCPNPESGEDIFGCYGLRLVNAHRELLLEDETYAERFRLLETYAVSRIGLRATERQGCDWVYPEALRLGIYHDLLKRAGPLPFAEIPQLYASLPPCEDDQPFFHFVDWGAPDDVPPSIQPFHYCSGAGGITISGTLADPHVRAHFWLYRHDPSYEEAYDRVVAPFVDRAEAVDPLDIEATAKITTDLRRALVEAGIAERIERRVESERATKGSDDDGEKSGPQED